MKKYDVVIAGGGILGTTLAYWLSSLYEGKIAVVEMEHEVAHHTSARNTGVIHRPFYLNPERRKVFAQSAQVSYGLWKTYAQARNLPWKEVRTIEVAVHPHEVKVLDKYLDWALKNGMDAGEVELLSPQGVKKIEPHVTCLGALYAKTDTAVNYKAFTQSIRADAEANSVEFLFGFKMKGVDIGNNGLNLFPEGGLPIETSYFINCAGGNAVDIAHLFGTGLDYTDLHFRGEYWQVSEEKKNLVNTNIYSVPRHAELPFLDPHWIVREDGRREIGPNAVLVAGCTAYKGFFTDLFELAGKIVERPWINKLRLFTNPEFLKLASEEWMSSLSKSAMVERVRQFIPEISANDFTCRGTAGIRSSVINSSGAFMKEAIEIHATRSFHVLNYNSPGATGSPAYTALLADKLSKSGALSHLKKRPSQTKGLWSFQEIISRF